MNRYKCYVFSFITFVETFNEVKLMIIGTYQVQPIPSNKDFGAHFGTILQNTTHFACTAADLTSNGRILSAQLTQCACAGLNRQWAMASGCRRKRILKR